MSAPSSLPLPLRTPQASVRSLHLLLASANFAVGLGAFVVIGLISVLSRDFGLSKAQAGWVMTVYALVYALSSPLLVALTGKLERARVLMLGMGLLTLATAVSGFSSNYVTLLVARAILALGAGLVTPVASAIAVASVPAAQRGKALAAVFGGLTLAQAFGIPLGTWFGYAFGWRSSFLAIAALSALILLLLGWFVPKGLTLQPTSLATLRQALSQPRWVLSLGFIVFFMGSVFSVITYFTPWLETVYGLGQTGITGFLLIFGGGAIVGNLLGGNLTDRLGPVWTLLGLGLALMILMPVLTLLHLPLPLFALLLALWSVAGWSVHVPQQARLASLDPAKVPVLLALHAAGLYIGNSLGSLLGGLTLGSAGYAWLGVTGAVLAGLALLTLWLAERPAALAA